jgi:hypothetical protein
VIVITVALIAQILTAATAPIQKATTTVVMEEKLQQTVMNGKVHNLSITFIYKLKTLYE